VNQIHIIEETQIPKDVTLWIFNLRLDLESTVLAAAHDWMVEFSHQVTRIKVISTHVGSINLPGNVSCSELGGGDFLSRCVAIKRLLFLLPSLWRTREDSIVFHHMSPKTAVILGIPIRIMRIPQGLWYSHAKNNLLFRISRSLVNYVFTPTIGTAPGLNRKYQFIGHGISEDRFVRPPNGWKRIPAEIVCVGRVSPAKRLEDLLEAFPVFSDSSLGENPSVLVCGDFDPHSSYFKSLKLKADNRNVKIVFIGPVNYSKINQYYAEADLFFSGTEASVDKAVIEAGLSGSLIVSLNNAALELTGMSRAWMEILGKPPTDLKSQIQILSRLSQDQKESMRTIIQATTLANNKLSNTTKQIVMSLDAIRK
jgi:glycosyltransferase involved in cell wall biosynthesis